MANEAKRLAEKKIIQKVLKILKTILKTLRKTSSLSNLPPSFFLFFYFLLYIFFQVSLSHQHSYQNIEGLCKTFNLPQRDVKKII